MELNFKFVIHFSLESCDSETDQGQPSDRVRSECRLRYLQGNFGKLISCNPLPIQSFRQDGLRCSNFVNTSLSEVCIFHVTNEARRLAARRGMHLLYNICSSKRYYLCNRVFCLGKIFCKNKPQPQQSLHLSHKRQH